MGYFCKFVFLLQVVRILHANKIDIIKSNDDDDGFPLDVIDQDGVPMPKIAVWNTDTNEEPQSIEFEQKRNDLAPKNIHNFQNDFDFNDHNFEPFQNDIKTSFTETAEKQERYWWIIFPGVLIVGIIAVIIGIFYRKNRLRVLFYRISSVSVFVPRNNETTSCSSRDQEGSVSSQHFDGNRDKNLPPSYEEAVVDVPHTTSLLR